MDFYSDRPVLIIDAIRKKKPTSTYNRNLRVAYVGGDPLEVIHFTQKPEEFKPFFKRLFLQTSFLSWTSSLGPLLV